MLSQISRSESAFSAFIPNFRFYLENSVSPAFFFSLLLWTEQRGVTNVALFMVFTGPSLVFTTISSLLLLLLLTFSFCSRLVAPVKTLRFSEGFGLGICFIQWLGNFSIITDLDLLHIITDLDLLHRFHEGVFIEMFASVAQLQVCSPAPYKLLSCSFRKPSRAAEAFFFFFSCN